MGTALLGGHMTVGSRVDLRVDATM